MSKFKVGDKVIRTAEKDFGGVVKGGIYEVSGVSDKSFANNYGINLVGHNYGEGYDYDSNSFELYVEDCLTPLQAAESILKEEKLQVYDTDCDKWFTFSCGHRNITIEGLKHIKLRLKPKTILINGVEVPAPLDIKPKQEFIYFINLFKSRVYQLPTEKLTFNHKNYWSTKEDAQKVLDAMLIPFNQFSDFNKGEQL